MGHAVDNETPVRMATVAIAKESARIIRALLTVPSQSKQTLAKQQLSTQADHRRSRWCSAAIRQRAHVELCYFVGIMPKEVSKSWFIKIVQDTDDSL